MLAAAIARIEEDRRHMALKLVRKETSKGSLRKKLQRAAWSDSFLAKVLAQL